MATGFRVRLKLPWLKRRGEFENWILELITEHKNAKYNTGVLYFDAKAALIDALIQGELPLDYAEVNFIEARIALLNAIEDERTMLGDTLDLLNEEQLGLPFRQVVIEDIRPRRGREVGGYASAEVLVVDFERNLKAQLGVIDALQKLYEDLPEGWIRDRHIITDFAEGTPHLAVQTAINQNLLEWRRLATVEGSILAIIEQHSALLGRSAHHIDARIRIAARRYARRGVRIRGVWGLVLRGSFLALLAYGLYSMTLGLSVPKGQTKVEQKKKLDEIVAVINQFPEGKGAIDDALKSLDEGLKASPTSPDYLSKLSPQLRQIFQNTAIKSEIDRAYQERLKIAAEEIYKSVLDGIASGYQQSRGQLKQIIFANPKITEGLKPEERTQLEQYLDNLERRNVALTPEQAQELLAQFGLPRDKLLETITYNLNQFHRLSIIRDILPTLPDVINEHADWFTKMRWGAFKPNPYLELHEHIREQIYNIGAPALNDLANNIKETVKNAIVGAVGEHAKTVAGALVGIPKAILTGDAKGLKAEVEKLLVLVKNDVKYTFIAILALLVIWGILRITPIVKWVLIIPENQFKGIGYSLMMITTGKIYPKSNR